MTFEKIRVASMGLGRWANVLANAAERGGKIELVSCFSRTKEKRKNFMESYGTREASSFEEFLKDDEIESLRQHVVVDSVFKNSEVKEKIAEAEANAEEDKRRKGKIELRNMADQVVYQTRRTLDETGDKLEDEDTAPVKEKLEELEKLVQDEEGKPFELEAIDEAAIQGKVKEVEEAMHAISSKLYEAAAAEMAAQEASAGDSDDPSDDVVDADFEVVDED